MDAHRPPDIDRISRWRTPRLSGTVDIATEPDRHGSARVPAMTAETNRRWDDLVASWPATRKTRAGSMAKKDRKDRKDRGRRDADLAQPEDEAEDVTSSAEPGSGKMKRKAYEAQMRGLHGELVAMQEWDKASGARVCVVFEGRDTAGRAARSSAFRSGQPPVFKVVGWRRRPRAVPMYVHATSPIPAACDVVIVDRSWYHRPA